MNLVERARLRLFRVWPTYWPSVGSVAHWDLVTSTEDARAALTLAEGRRPDPQGYPLPD